GLLRSGPRYLHLTRRGYAEPENARYSHECDRTLPPASYGTARPVRAHRGAAAQHGRQWLGWRTDQAAGRINRPALHPSLRRGYVALSDADGLRNPRACGDGAALPDRDGRSLF